MYIQPDSLFTTNPPLIISTSLSLLSCPGLPQPAAGLFEEAH